MFQSPDHYLSVSLRLSEVLNDIGVNQQIVDKRRKSVLLLESFQNISCKLNNDTASIFYFGSQSEGSTTEGLHSDVDTLYCPRDISVIPDWREWNTFSGRQFLMIQNQTTAPGYCLLQPVRQDVPLPVQGVQDEYLKTDTQNNLLLKHSFCFGIASRYNELSIFSNNDSVVMLICSTWPREADPWLHKQNPSGWPTEDMKKYAAQTGCFLVPVASRESVHEDTEWRISTSQAERCLMFSLNITQLRCYILMKMLKRTFLNDPFEGCVTSFMCKTVLFSCIADSRDSSMWNEHNLLVCLNMCFQRLLHCIRTGNCPHFVFPGNNLLAGRLSLPVKQQLVERISSITEDVVGALRCVRTDDLGIRLVVKSGDMRHLQFLGEEYIKKVVSSKQSIYLISSLQIVLKKLLNNATTREQIYAREMFLQCVSRLHEIHSLGSDFERRACTLTTPFLCTVLGSLAAAIDVAEGRGLSLESLRWFSTGIDSDCASSRLKLASALYSAGDYNRCKTILNDLRTTLSMSTVLSTCLCNKTYLDLPEGFLEDTIEKNEEVVRENIAFCVRYLPSETCIPNELKYEIFRSTGGDDQYRGEDDFWMNWAAVDSVPYLYFLQYKVYSRVHKPADQRRALENLARTIYTDLDFGHKETALNLLGQCYEQENRIQEAMCCYMMSLNVRNRNNAAKWHICRLLSSQISHQQRRKV